jgi:hypothetical protein
MKWSNGEKEKIISLIKDGKKYKEISEIVNRSESSIRSIAFRCDEKSSTYYVKKTKEVVCLECSNNIIDLSCRTRKFCSQSCSAIYNNKLRKKNNADLIICLNCGDEVLNKKYCNVNCQKLYERKKIFERIENGDITLYEGTYKKYLIYKYGNKCMSCGWSEINSVTGKVPIQLEHIDGNSSNNNLNNLKLLCPNCHSLTPTFGALNRGNGRKNRKR